MPRPANSKQDVFKHVEMSNSEQCWKWLGSWGGGRNGKQQRPYFDVDNRKYIAYRLVYELVRGYIPGRGEVIRHTCDNGSYPVGCCNPSHLIIGSHNENMKDMTDRERHGMPHHVIKNIRKLIQEGRPHHEIAALYGTTRSNVTKIANNVSYQHLEEDDDNEEA